MRDQSRRESVDSTASARPPETDEEGCPECGTGLLESVYGMPGRELFEAAERGEIALGGCVVPMYGGPMKQCSCGHMNDGGDGPDIVDGLR